MLSKLFVVAAVIAGTAFAAPRPGNVQKLKRASGPAVKDEYVVVLKDGASREASLNSLNNLVFALDDTTSVKELKYTDWKVLNGYAAKLSGAALEHVLNDPNVDYVEENAIFSINWEAGYDDVSAREASPEPQPESEVHRLVSRAAGSGVDIYSIDTGVLTTHTSFGSRARWGATYGGYAARDGNGHGTHTAGTFGGVGFGPATQAGIIAVKVLSDTGSGTLADVTSGVNYVATSARSSGRPSVGNLSLGGGVSTSLDTAVRNAVNGGVHLTLAAGNSNVNAANTSPARVTEAVTVGALTSARAKASFSNFGAVVDVWFLGVSVTSAWIGSNSATNTISGTSMAAPGVAGILAVRISNVGNTSAASLQAALKAAAVADATGIPSGTTNLRAVQF